ncbi:hypothetical protein BP00DRAFT_449230 [Aspergillus indologenus CBS 114.80]|uniref:Uncharacterized protein n=1 Tax=Aspergillus indologenus CBS 114.80 TaxID=1450541 RepID=A0A2V5IJ11_9EURO|nr:hypothetical protein BP00DRAFT_449230 [Aspergillus indologenus CBS 114.80]
MLNSQLEEHAQVRVSVNLERTESHLLILNGCTTYARYLDHADDVDRIMAWLNNVISMAPLPEHAVRLRIMVTVSFRTMGPAARAMEVHAAVTGSSSEPQSNPDGMRS